jgi:hypothetical protein
MIAQRGYERKSSTADCRIDLPLAMYASHRKISYQGARRQTQKSHAVLAWLFALK